MLNIILKIENTKVMQIFYSSVYYLIFILPFIFTQFIHLNLLFSLLLFILYLCIIRQYYCENNKIIEIKDFIFTFIYLVLLVLSYRLFGIDIKLNEIYLLYMICFISILSFACQIRNQ